MREKDNCKVLLFDFSYNIFSVNPDDTLAKDHSNFLGVFSVTGSEFEVNNIRPYLRITHKCNVKDVTVSFWKTLKSH